MIEKHPESQPPDDGRPKHDSEFDPARDDYFASAHFDRLVGSSRIVYQIESLLDQPPKLGEFVAAELARIELTNAPEDLAKERETLLYAFEWIFNNLSESFTATPERMLAAAEQAAVVFERFSDKPLLGARRQCETFEHALVSMINSLFDEVRVQDELSSRFCTMLGCLGRGFAVENALGRSTESGEGAHYYTDGHSQIYERMQGDLLDLAASRIEDVPNFASLRVFPDAYSLHELNMISAVVNLAGQAGLYELREHCHFLFVKVYNWYLKNVPEVGIFGGEALPEPEPGAETGEYKDSEGNDRDAAWRESLRSDEERLSGETDEVQDPEPEEYFNSAGAHIIPPDMSTAEQRVVAMDRLLFSLLDGFSTILSPHVSEPTSAAVREGLLTLIEDISPEWFAWPMMLSVYASISADCMVQARIPLEEKLLKPLLRGNSQLADGLIQFIDSGRDQLELCAAVMHGYTHAQRQHIIELIRDAGSEIEITLHSDSEGPGILINPTIDQLEKALRRSGVYVELPE